MSLIMLLLLVEGALLSEGHYFMNSLLDYYMFIYYDTNGPVIIAVKTFSFHLPHKVQPITKSCINVS